MTRDNSSNDKPLRTGSFVAHSARGIIRDQNVRRKAMFILVLVSLFLLFAGSTFLQPALNPHEHPVWFIAYWLICGWFALTAILLTIYDMLMIRLEGRRANRRLQDTLKTDSPESTADE